jgi:hypothetical protein
MSLWAFRFLLWYLCILLVQPQNRFTFLWPFRMAMRFDGGRGHFACRFNRRRRIVRMIRFGPATRAALFLMVLQLYFQPDRRFSGQRGLESRH